MGWDYWTYSNQPAFFIQQIMEFIGMEATADKVRSVEQEQRRKLDLPTNH